MTERRPVRLVVLGLVGGLLAVAPAAEGPDYRHAPLADGVVALVNGESVSCEKLLRGMLEEAGGEVLDRLVKESLVRQSARGKGITFTEEELDRETEGELNRVRDRITSQAGGDAFGLEELLQSRGVTMEQFLADLRQQVRRRLELECLALMERLARERVEIRLIQVDRAQEMEQVQERLAEGEDPDRVAALYSRHESRREGGRLRPFARGELFPEALRAVEQAAFSTAPGEWSSPVVVALPGGVEARFLVQVVRRIPPRDEPFPALHDPVMEALESDPPRRAELDRWMRQALDATSIAVDPSGEVAAPVALPYPREVLGEQVAARVGEETIPRTLLQRELLARAGEDVLDRLVKETLVAQRARQAGVSFTDVELDGATREELVRVREVLRADAGGEAPSLEDLLAAQGLTLDQFTAELREQVRRRMELECLVLLDRLSQERVEIRVLQVDTPQEARDMVNRLAAGADFAKLATLFSRHESARDGGLLPAFGRGHFSEMYRRVEEAAFSTPPGQISEPIRVVNQKNREEYHIVKVIRRQEPRAGIFSASRAEILDLERTDPPRQDEMDDWMRRAIESSSITVDPK